VYKLFAVVSVAEMRALEAAAIEAGTPERVLQERAGLAVADVIEAELAAAGRRGDRPPRIVVLVGAGNNGRDAVVAGRRLAARGCEVDMWWGARCPLSDVEQMDIRFEVIFCGRFDQRYAYGVGALLHESLERADFAIDGLLGVGMRGMVRPEYTGVLSALASARRRQTGMRIVAVDVPSGVDADTGEIAGMAVDADITVTFGAVKAGLLLFPGAAHVGRLIPARIGLSSNASLASGCLILNERANGIRVPARALDAHKYRVGRVLVVAGSDQYVGAACLCSEAAARSGAGLVGLVSTEAVKRVLAARLPEATYPLTLTDLDERPEAAADAVAALLPEQSALLIGPGIGRSDPMNRFLRQLLTQNAQEERPTPAVIDADALSLLAGWPRWWEHIGQDNVLTPHAGEMARLLASDSELGAVDGEAPWHTARRAAERWRQVIVLKGPFTCVAEPSPSDDELEPALVFPFANPALATAGTGDVLAGLMAGLLAQGLHPAWAAQLAVAAHALAARRAVERHGGRTLLASDLPIELPAVLAGFAVGDPSVQSYE